jgi:hypothetical protein
MRRLAFVFLLATSSCAIDRGEAESTEQEDAVVVDTSNPRARAQYEANVAFARAYAPRCSIRGSNKRVLVTGFGRFLSNSTNATGQIVSRLVPEATYPMTTQPEDGAVDPPEPQTSVALGTVQIDGAPVDVCAMILPVYWDLAAILIAKELEAFAPDFVMMNGIAGSHQPLWIELGSVNRAMALEDGSDVLRPVPPAGQTHAPIVPGAAARDEKKGLLLSWNAVKTGALQAIAARKDTLGSVLDGAAFAGYPRSSNTYLCNNTAYVTNYVMSYPGRSVTLLKASTSPTSVRTRVARDLRQVPRVFVHWPSALKGDQLDAAADVMKAIMGAQLAATARGDRATVGDNAMAEISPSGDTF